jgi:hypothetical protein
MTQSINSSGGSNGTINQAKKRVPAMDVGTFINDELESDTDEAENPFRDKFRRSILDQSVDYPLPEPVINLVQNSEKTPLLTLKSYSLWQGKQKSRKTTLLALAIAAYINPNSQEEAICFESAIPGKVLVFDNEQGQGYAARTMNLILKLADIETSPNLIYCDLREYSPAERIKIIEAGIECTPEARLLIIDGIVDLLTDFMDPAEGHMTITNIIKLCSVHNIHVAGVLHQNKADKNARAHVGTISSQKCEIEIATEVDPDNLTQSLVTCVNSRGLPFEPFAIKWEKGSLPCICQDWSKASAVDAKTMKNYVTVEQLAKEVFKPFQAIKRADAMDEIMVLTKQGDSTAKRRFNEMVKWKLVMKGHDGLYRINVEMESKGQEGSNIGS